MKIIKNDSNQNHILCDFKSQIKIMLDIIIYTVCNKRSSALIVSFYQHCKPIFNLKAHT